MSKQVSMFSSAVDDTTAATDSSVVSVGDRGNVTLATSGSVTMGSCVLTVQVSYDQGTNWKDLVDSESNTVQLSSGTAAYYFQADGGLLRVSPSGATGSTSIAGVILVGDVYEHTAPS